MIAFCRGGRIFFRQPRGAVANPARSGYGSPRRAKAIVTRIWHTQLILTRVGKRLFHWQESSVQHAKGIIDQPVDLDSFA